MIKDDKYCFIYLLLFVLILLWIAYLKQNKYHYGKHTEICVHIT